MRFKKKKEVFIGNLRVNVDKEAEEFLRAQVPIDERCIDGVYVTKWPDGHIEIERFYDRAMRLVKEMKEAKE